MNATGTRKNLRHYKRISAKLEAKVIGSNENAATIAISNLSRAGLMLACDSDTLNKILPNTSPIIPRKPIQLTIEFNLPVVATQSVIVTAKCNVIYTRRLSRDSFQVGLEFDSVDNNGHSYIDQYIDAQQKAC